MTTFLRLTQRRDFAEDGPREEPVLINVDRIAQVSPNRNGCRLIVSGARHAFDVTQTFDDVFTALNSLQHSPGGVLET